MKSTSHFAQPTETLDGTDTSDQIACGHDGEFGYCITRCRLADERPVLRYYSWDVWFGVAHERELIAEGYAETEDQSNALIRAVIATWRSTSTREVKMKEKSAADEAAARGVGSIGTRNVAEAVGETDIARALVVLCTEAARILGDIDSMQAKNRTGLYTREIDSAIGNRQGILWCIMQLEAVAQGDK